MSGNKRLLFDENIALLIGQLRQLIADARNQVLRAVDVIQVRTCWEIGRHIVKSEQGGAAATNKHRKQRLLY